MFRLVQGAQVKLWFKGQPILCDICQKEGHRASSCPDRVKGFHCHEAGCLARNCPRPWGAHTGPSAPPPATEVHPHTGNGVPPLVHAEDLDQGFGPLSGGGSLAEAASVTEAVLKDNSAPSVVDPGFGVGGSVEGASASVAPLLEMDVRFNQLDKLASQSCSSSILTKCGAVAASSGGSQIVINSNLSIL